MRSIDQLPPVCALTWNLTHNLFDVLDDTPTNQIT